MAEVVGAAQQRRGQLLGCQRELADLLPDLPPGRLQDGIAVLAAEQAAVRARAELLEVGTQQGDELGRDRDPAGGLAGSRVRAGSPPGPSLQAA
jgi:hypothetical protein